MKSQEKVSWKKLLLLLLFSHSLVSDCCDPMDCSPGYSLWDFPGKNTGVGCHSPSPGDLPDPGIEPMSPALVGRFFTTEPPGKSLGRRHRTYAVEGLEIRQIGGRFPKMKFLHMKNYKC